MFWIEHLSRFCCAEVPTWMLAFLWLLSLAARTINISDLWLTGSHNDDRTIFLSFYLYCIKISFLILLLFRQFPFFLAIFHVFLLFFFLFSSFLGLFFIFFCLIFFLLSQYSFVTVQRLQRLKASSLHSHKTVSVIVCYYQTRFLNLK